MAPVRLPARLSLASLRLAAKDCRACPLWKTGTQTVFGEGPRSASIVLVGEQPGDHEDKGGRPFVGPAGLMLDKALEEAGLERRSVYVTNAVKHFKWEPRGRRRIHAKPSRLEVAACHPWLEGELELIRPRVTVALGATAAQALMGPTFRVTRRRGVLLDFKYGRFLATLHPSAILRAPDPESRRAEYQRFVRDLRVLA